MKTKAKNITIWLIAGLLSFAFFGSGITKLIGVEMQIKNLESWGYPLWMRFPIGLSEVVFAIGLLIPSYRKWVIYSIFGWGIVAVFTHIQATPSQYNMIGAPLVFLLLNTMLLLFTKAKSIQSISNN